MKSRWGQGFLLGILGTSLLIGLGTTVSNHHLAVVAPTHSQPPISLPVPDASSASIALLLGLMAGGGGILLWQQWVQFWSDRQHTRQALKQAEARYRHLVEDAVVGIFQTTPQGTFLNANPALAQILGYDCVTALQTTLTDLDRQLYVQPGRRREFVALMQEYSLVSKFESQVYRADGQIIWISETAKIVYDAQNRPLAYEGFVTDVTAHKQIEAQLLHDSLHDSLTGLPNRLLFTQKLAVALNQAQQRQGHPFAVVFVNLDRFHQVNENLGRALGDQLLIEVSRRLRYCLRSHDTCARIGGDEFAILLEEVRDYYTIRQVIDRVQQEFKLSFVLGEQTFNLSASVGSILGSPNYERAEDVLRDAEAALQRSRTQVTPTLERTVNIPNATSISHLSLVSELKRAIEHQEFQLHYQPIVKMRNGQVLGFEALVRWQHPRQGLIPAHEFIAIAEETGLSIPLGWWTIREACHQLKTWQVRFDLNHPLTISINLSTRQFTHPELVSQLEQILQELELNAGNLKLEVTEKTIMADPELSSTRLWQLQELGIQVAIDDFGTGYSCLTHLHHFPIQTLKIDRSFMAGIERETEKLEMIRTIVTLAWNLGMDVVAEGVETQKQRSQLQALNCDVGQGYLFSKPLNSDAAAVLLAEIDGAKGVF